MYSVYQYPFVKMDSVEWLIEFGKVGEFVVRHLGQKFEVVRSK
jgi:hypothetical protein